MSTNDTIRQRARLVLQATVKEVSAAIGDKADKDFILPSVTEQIAGEYPNIDPNLIQSLIQDLWEDDEFIDMCSDKSRAVHIDFENTIADCNSDLGTPIPGAIESIKKLKSDGWRVVVCSNKGKDYVSKWLLIHGIKVDSVIRKSSAVWHISNNTVNVDRGWSAACNAIHGSDSSKSNSIASSILSGKYGLSEIADMLKCPYNQLYTDLGKVYGNKSPVECIAYETMMYDKYGLKVSVEEIARQSNPDRYWRVKLADLVDKYVNNSIASNDAVFIKYNEHCGSIGKVIKLNNSVAKVAVDGDTSKCVFIPECNSNLILIPVHKRESAFKSTASDVVINPNSYYSNGLTRQDVKDWYSLVDKKLFANIYGSTIRLIHTFDNDFISNRDIGKPASLNQVSGFNNGRMIEVYNIVSPTTNFAWIKVESCSELSLDPAKQVITDLVHNLSSYSSLKDIQVRFAGNNDFYVVMLLDRGMPVESIKQDLSETVHEYVDSLNYKVGSNGLRINVDSFYEHASILSPYSLNSSTGLACIPLDISEIESFEKKDANIYNVAKNLSGNLWDRYN